MTATLPSSWFRKLTCLGCVLTLFGCGSKPAAIPATRPQAAIAAPPRLVAIVSEPAADGAKELFGRIRGTYDESIRNGWGLPPERTMFVENSKDLTQIPTQLYGEDEDVSWVKLTLNQYGLGFDAVGFESPDDRADLVYAFALRSEDTPRLRWYAFSKSGNRLDFPPVHASHKFNIAVADLPFDDANTFIFGHLAQQQISPGFSYSISFVIDGKEPLDMYVKLKLLNAQAHKIPVITTSHDAAAALGMTLPFKLTPNASLTDQASEELELHGPDAALKFLEDTLAVENDWKACHQYVHLANDHAAKLVAEEQVNEAMGVYLRAAAGVRKLRDTSLPPDERPCELIPLMLYNEACALARGGKANESIAALREAVAAGCTDIAMIRGDEDLTPLHDNEDFKRLITELEAR